MAFTIAQRAAALSAQRPAVQSTDALDACRAEIAEAFNDEGRTRMAEHVERLRATDLGFQLRNLQRRAA